MHEPFWNADRRILFHIILELVFRCITLGSVIAWIGWPKLVLLWANLIIFAEFADIILSQLPPIEPLRHDPELKIRIPPPQPWRDKRNN